MPTDPATLIPIVGIGASAGGLEALKSLVRAIPPDSGAAYVIVQHLAPDHPSIMDQLLASHSGIPVAWIDDGAKPEADTAYLIPAGPSVTIEDGRFHLHARERARGPRTPIDEFLTSLATDRREKAICVILSGTGSDGTLGLKAIKAAGGFAIVQQSESARFPGMPDSAAATGLVDLVLKPAEIAPRIVDIIRHREDLDQIQRTERTHHEVEEALGEILELVDSEQGHDFSQYKTGTLIRRIERRMTLLQHRSVKGLLETLERDADERTRLVQDFLIGVTQFFRNEESFEVLRRRVVLPLLERTAKEFRIWVPGCSTGEEAYSIAMLFAEAMDEAGDNRSCKIFGTDIDSAALADARAGTYAESLVSGLTDQRRERFLIRRGGNFMVAPELREQCVFAPHNILQDPPFSRIDLISCRNLLIYLTSEIQESIIPRFHYALKEGGYLFLGPSETLGKQERFFKIVDRDARLFQRNDAQAPGYSTLAAPAVSRSYRQRPARLAAQSGAAPLEHSFEQQVTHFFLRQSAPPFAVIDAHDEISFISERMGEFIRPPTGTVSAALDQFLGRELRLPVRTAITRARDSGAPATAENIVVGEGESARLVDVDVRGLPFAEGSLLVTLQPVRSETASIIADSQDERSSAEREQIERELVLTRRRLSATLSDFESMDQELRSSNEELLSMNEELQSSNEELETSREELQSINEELETINAELRENNRLLAEANSDLSNLFESTDIATVFLDQNLCVRRYTPASRRLFAIQDRDVGRSIMDLAWRASYDSLEDDAQAVTSTLQPIEREVRIEATDETFLMRMSAYRRTDDRIDGCAITFFDITERKRFEKQIAEYAEKLHHQYAELETLYDTAPVGLNLLDRELRYLRTNKRLAEINGFPVADHIGKQQDELLPEIDARVRDMQLLVLATGEPVLGFEVHGTTPAEPHRKRDWVADFYPVRSGNEVIAVGSCVTEVTEQKELQRQLERSLAAVEESEAKLRRLFDAAPVFIAMHGGENHRYIYANPAHSKMIGGRDVDGKPLAEAMPEFADQGVLERFDGVFETGQSHVEAELSMRFRRDGSGELKDGWFTLVLQPWYTETGRIGGVMSFAFEITEFVEARRAVELSQEALRSSEARLSAALRAGRLGVFEYDTQSKNIEWDDAMRRLCEFPEDTAVTYETTMACVHPDDRSDMEAELARALDPHGDQRFELDYRIIQRNSGRVRWVHAEGQATLDRANMPSGLVGTLQDITERREAEEQQELLLHELQHRVKNTMATTLAIVQFSAKRATDPESFTKTLRARLHAMAATHDLLTASDWSGSRLADIFTRQLEPYGGKTNRRTRFTGDDVALSPKQTLALALAFHELSTNAAKYGALSADDGRVELESRRYDGNRVQLTWTESGVPAVDPPGKDTGFGTFLLNRILGAEIDGNVRLDYAATGVVCRVDFPLL